MARGDKNASASGSCRPGHPIAAGLGEYFEIPHEEMYGEHFDIPDPDELVFVSWFQGGEVFRSGCCYYRGEGKIFYFRPGHETLPDLLPDRSAAGHCQRRALGCACGPAVG